MSDRPILKGLDDDKNGPYFYRDSAGRVLGSLRAALALADRVPAKRRNRPSGPQRAAPKRREPAAATSRKVFVVHGHDQALLQQVARFLERLQLEPIVLFEQPAEGQTIIEKLERHSDVRFAVVLLTPDDVGKAARDDGAVRPRARQNVLLEMGYFLGRVGRDSVVALYHESVELPSDYRGVEYIKIDAEGAWMLKLARELKAASLPVDMNRAI